MNKKIVALFLVILISFCFISIAVANNAASDDNNTTHHKKVVKKQTQVNKNTTDKNKINKSKNKTDDKSKNKTDDKSKNYIIAKGNGNNIMFSDGFRGYILDYSKPPASIGDEFKRASTSKVSNSNAMKLAIIDNYRDNSADYNESSNILNKRIGDHEVVKINNHTEAVFDFEVLQSVSGNTSDYFAYKVSFRKINDNSEKAIAHANNTTNVTNTTNATNITNATNMTNATNLTNATNMTNITNMTNLTDINETALMEAYAYLLLLVDALYDSWEPIIHTLIQYEMMVIYAMQELVKMAESFMREINALMYALKKMIYMLESLWKQLNGLLKLIAVILNSIQQLLNLIASILNYIAGIIMAIISLIQQILGWLFALISFISNLINQLMLLIQALMDFLKAAGNYLFNVIKNGAIIIVSFVIVTIAAFIYNRKR